MVLFRLSALLFTLLVTLPAAPVRGQPTVIRHDLAVWLNPDGRSLAGIDTVAVRPAGERSLVFSLSAGISVDSVTAAGERVPFSRTGGLLRVDLPADPGNVQERHLTISYGGRFDDPVPEDPVNTEDPSYGVRGTIGKKGTFLSGAAGWYPEIAGSRPTFRVLVAAPAGYEAVTAGELVRRETECGLTRSEWEIREPLGGLSLSAGPYVVREGRSGGTALFTYFYPETDSLAPEYLAAAGRYLDLYRNLLGPYPFGKFAVVENFFPTGYGFPSYTLLGSTVIRLPFILDTSLGHEVAHSWFGNGVRVDGHRGNWSEGLTTYLADYLYKERSSAAEGREYRLKILRDYSTLVPPENDFPLSSFAGRDSPASRAIGYGKAAMIFHMARRLAGEDAFWNGLRRVVRERMFREASWDDFGRAIGRESGGDFAPFFRQWVDRPGAPAIALAGIAAEEEGGRWKIRGRIVQQKPYFDLRVPLRLATEGKNRDTVLSVSGETTSFSLAADERPLRLVVDPDVDLFRRLDPAEIPPTVNGIRGSTDLLVVAARGIPGDLLEGFRTVLAAMGREDARVVREEDTPAAGLAEHDVLYLGLPAGKGYLPPLPRTFSAAPDRFTLDGTPYGSPGDALFAVLPHPAGGGRVAALFLALSPQAASQAARKIPHYGKYSYLVFSGGTNRAKGTWEIAASPLIWRFSPRDPAASGEVPAADRR